MATFLIWEISSFCAANYLLDYGGTYFVLSTYLTFASVAMLDDERNVALFDICLLFVVTC